MYAVVKTGGKQYRVEGGDVITVEKLEAKVGSKVQLECLLKSDGKAIKVGTPLLDETIEAKVVEHGKGDKVIIYKYKAKKDYRRKQGHRQPYTKLEITGLASTGKKSVAKRETAKKTTAKSAPKDAPKNADVKVSESMKKDELLTIAKDNGIKVDAKAAKADIIKAIKESLK